MLSLIPFKRACAPPRSPELLVVFVALLSFVVISFACAMAAFVSTERLSYWGYVSLDFQHAMTYATASAGFAGTFSAFLQAAITTVPTVRATAFYAILIMFITTMYTDFAVAHLAVNSPAFVTVFASLAASVSMAFIESTAGGHALTLQCIATEIPFIAIALALSGSLAADANPVTFTHSLASRTLIGNAPTQARAAGVMAMLILLQFIRCGYGIRATQVMHRHVTGFVRRPLMIVASMHCMAQLLGILYIAFPTLHPEIGFMIAHTVVYYPLLFTPLATLHILSSSHDVEKAAMSAVRDAQHKVKLAETATAARRQFLRWVFHESRSPFQSLVYGIEDLRESGTVAQDSEAQSTLHVMSLAADSMRKIMDGVLDLERIESGQFSIELAPFSVTALLEAMLTPIRANAAHVAVTLQSRVSRSVPPFLLGDSSRLTRVIANFCGNAIKFVSHSGGGVVDLKVRLLTRDEVAGLGTATGVVRGSVLSREAHERLTHLQESSSQSSFATTPTSTQAFPAAAGSEWNHPLPPQGATGSTSSGGTDNFIIAEPRMFVQPSLTLSSAESIMMMQPMACLFPCCRRVSLNSPTIDTAHAMLPAASVGGTADSAHVADAPLHAVQVEGLSHPLPFTPHPGTQYSTAVDASQYTVSSDVVWLRVEVVDNGCGIRESDQARLFNPFVQVKAGMLQKGKGTGLGLHISKEIVVRHGGRIGVKSNDAATGTGSTFWMDVPMIICHQIGAQHDDAHAGAHTMTGSGLPLQLPDPATGASATVTPHIVAPATVGGSYTSAPDAPLVRVFPGSESARPARNAGDAGVDPASAVNVNPIAGAAAAFDRSGSGSSHSRASRNGRSHSSRSLNFDRADAAGAGTLIDGPSNRVYDVTSDEVRIAVVPPAIAAGSSSAPTAAPVAAVAAGSSSPLDGVITSVLIVDDADSNRLFLRRLLQRRLPRAVIREAADGLQALTLYNACMDAGEPIHAVLLDKEMPQMDGYQVARRLRDAAYAGTIIGLTGNALQRDREEFLSHGCDAVLTKPVSMTELMSVLAFCVHARHAEVAASLSHTSSMASLETRSSLHASLA